MTRYSWPSPNQNEASIAGGRLAGETRTLGIPNYAAEVARDAALTELLAATRDDSSVIQFGATGDGVTDDTTAIQAAVTRGGTVRFPAGTFAISDAIVIGSNTAIVLEAGSTVRQTGAEKNIFRATEEDNVWIVNRGGVLYGKGSYTNSEVTLVGREDRGIQFFGCTRSGALFPIVKNCGAVGISIIGGDQIHLVCPIVEGTHEYSVPITSQANFQVGIMLKHDETYGNLDNCVVLAPNISGTTQGLLVESNDGLTPIPDTLNITIVNPVIHDIPGQHGFYIQTGKIAISNPVIDNCELSGVKIQSSDTDIKGFAVTGAVISNTGSQAFEIAALAGGSITGVHITGVVYGCGRGISTTGIIADAKIDLVVMDADEYGALIQGEGPHDIDLVISSSRTGLEGVLITATLADDIRIWAKVREPNTDESTASGIRISSASAAVTLFDPDVEDADANMVNGIFSDTVGAEVRIRGSVRAVGGSAYGVRFAGPTVEFPTEATLSGTTLPIHDLSMLISSQPVVTSVRSTSTSPVVIWERALSDESVYSLTAEVVGKLAASGERAVFTTNACAYRNGAGATIEGTPDVVATTASASFAGVLAWAVSGNSVQLTVHSGATANVDWRARTTVVVFAD